MAWDFTVDSDIQLDMAKMLKNKADELDTQFANLYTQIGPSNLGTHWVGSDYDAFNVGCEGYKQALQDMTDSIRMYADHFESVAEGTDALSSMCISIVQNMTTRGDALPGGQLPVAPNINNPSGGNYNGGNGYTNPQGGTYGGSTSTVYGPPTGGTNRFNGGSGSYSNSSTVYGPPPTGNSSYGTGGTYTNPSTVYGPPSQNQGGYVGVTSTVYGPPPTGNSGYGTGGTYTNPSTVYGPPSQNQGGYVGVTSTVYGPPPTEIYENSDTSTNGGTATIEVSTVYGPPPTNNRFGGESTGNVSTVYGPAPKPEIGYGEGYKETPVCVYAPPQYTEGEGRATIQPSISTVYGAPTMGNGEIVYPDRGSSSSSPISTVYGAPIRDGGSISSSSPISTVYGAPMGGTGGISTVYGAPVNEEPKIVKL